MKKEPYTCIRCRYTSYHKACMRYHLYKNKKTCPATKNVIELTDEIKQHILDNRIYKEPKTSQNVRLELEYHKNKKSELFYQLLLEKHLGGSHKALSCGITDVTTENSHSEIKEWKSWKEGVGQLHCYNKADPKENLNLYLFGSCSKKCKKEAIDISLSFGFNVYEFVHENDKVKIIDLAKDTTNYIYDPK